MQSLIIKTLIIIQQLVKSPLTLLRLTLPVFFTKKLLAAFSYDFYSSFDPSYSLAKTWFLNILPDFFYTLSPTEFIMVKYAILISGICAVIGVLGRLNLLFLAFMGYFIFGLGEGYGLFDHHMSLPSQVMFALALVPGTMKISIDDWIVNRFVRNETKAKSPKWGTQLVLLLVVLTYFTAGVSKLRYGHGAKWLDGSTLSFYLKERTDKYENGTKQIVFSDNQTNSEALWKDEFGFVAHTYGNYQTLKKWNHIADYVANSKFLVILLSVGSLLFELLAFVVFVNSKYRNIYLVSAIVFHMSIGQLMGISFRQYRLICFCLIDWHAIFKYAINFASKFTFVQQLKLNPIFLKIRN
ncbi:HTTM domain-containing protein [Flavobacteriaceae bacterium SZ-1-7]|uniref:HTTM domain-containing protein n=1 Tax=Tamlana sedimenti TaxID=3134126 RepID=UPI0031213F3B